MTPRGSSAPWIRTIGNGVNRRGPGVVVTGAGAGGAAGVIAGGAIAAGGIAGAGFGAAAPTMMGCSAVALVPFTAMTPRRTTWGPGVAKVAVAEGPVASGTLSPSRSHDQETMRGRESAAAKATVSPAAGACGAHVKSI